MLFACTLLPDTNILSRNFFSKKKHLLVREKNTSAHWNSKPSDIPGIS